VPSAVPSLCHKEKGEGLAAMKYKVSCTTATGQAYEALGPGLMSFTRCVPSPVPSVSQSSHS
jgi:hypothetical protein